MDKNKIKLMRRYRDRRSIMETLILEYLNGSYVYTLFIIIF